MVGDGYATVYWTIKSGLQNEPADYPAGSFSMVYDLSTWGKEWQGICCGRLRMQQWQWHPRRLSPTEFGFSADW